MEKYIVTREQLMEMINIVNEIKKYEKKYILDDIADMEKLLSDIQYQKIDNDE